MFACNYKTAVLQQPGALNGLYLVNNSSQGRSMNEPGAEYTVSRRQKFRDELEEYLFRCHFHQLSLLAMVSHEAYRAEDDWEFGAYLAGLDLKRQGKAFVQSLSHLLSEDSSVDDEGLS